MASLLTCIHSIRELVEKEKINTPHSVLDLFRLLLEPMVTEEKSEEMVLLEVLSAGLLKLECKITPQIQNEMRKKVEKKAPEYYSAGDLDALPTDLISHSLSFLGYEDRMPVECVCRSLFIHSRVTPISKDHEIAALLYDHHIVAPKKLLLERVLPKDKLVYLDTSQTTEIEVWNGADACSLMIKAFPVLRSVRFIRVEMDQIINDECRIWDLISANKVSKVGIMDCGNISAEHCSALMNLLSQNRGISRLIMRAVTMDPNSPLSPSLKLKKMVFRECVMNVALLGSMVNPDLTHLSFHGGLLNSLNDSSQITDWSLFNLPKLQELHLQCCGCLTLTALCSIIDNYGPLWQRLRDVYFSVGQVKFCKLYDFLHRISALPVRRLLISVCDFQPGDPSVEMDDISNILSQFPNLEWIVFHCLKVDPSAETVFYRWMIQLYHLHQSDSPINVRFFFKSRSILDRFEELCNDRELVDSLREWVKVRRNLDIFSQALHW